MRLACSVSTTCLRASSACDLLAQLVDLLDLLVELGDLGLQQRVAAVLVLDLRGEDDVDQRRRPRAPRTASADRQRDELALARLALLLAVRQQVDADHGYSNLRIARPQAISSSGASSASWRGRMRSDIAMLANGLATTVATPARLATSSSRPGQQRAAAGEHDLVDLVVRRRREEELQRAGDFQRQRFHERLQHVGVVVLRQPLVLLGRLGLFRRQVERALDVLGQLVAAEGLVAGEQELIVAQDVEVHDVGADVDQRDVLVAAVGRQRRRDQPERLLRSRTTRRPSPRGLQAGGLGDGDAVLDLFLARGRDQHLDFVGVVRRRAEDLEVEVDLVERERDVLVGLGLDLELELLFASGRPGR